MTLFNPNNITRSEKRARLYALYELAFTVVDFSAALLFVIGSWLFFYRELQELGTWMFLIGSVFFAAKPSIRLSRELHYALLGHFESIAERVDDD